MCGVGVGGWYGGFQIGRLSPFSAPYSATQVRNSPHRVGSHTQARPVWFLLLLWCVSRGWNANATAGHRPSAFPPIHGRTHHTACCNGSSRPTRVRCGPYSPAAMPWLGVEVGRYCGSRDDTHTLEEAFADTVATRPTDGGDVVDVDALAACGRDSVWSYSWCYGVMCTLSCASRADLRMHLRTYICYHGHARPALLYGRGTPESNRTEARAAGMHASWCSVCTHARSWQHSRARVLLLPISMMGVRVHVKAGLDLSAESVKKQLKPAALIRRLVRGLLSHTPLVCLVVCSIPEQVGGTHHVCLLNCM